MAASLTTSLTAVTFLKCLHMEEMKMITPLLHSQSVLDIWKEHHRMYINGDFVAKCSPNLNPSHGFEVCKSVTVGELVLGFNIKSLEFSCKILQTESLDSVPSSIYKNAFEILMSKQLDTPPRKTKSSGVVAGLNRKDELYNDIISSKFEKGNLTLHKPEAADTGAYIVQVLCNALWYLSPHHITIHDASLRKSQVEDVPNSFESFSGYNDVRRKKLKSHPLSSQELTSHGQALYSLLLKPIFSSSENWNNFGTEIKQLADCMLSYRDHLLVQCQLQQENQSQEHPVRSIANDATLQHVFSTRHVKSAYLTLDKLINEMNELEPLLFDEHLHPDILIETNKQRYNYLHNLQLSVPIDIIKYCSGGSQVVTVCIAKVKENRSQTEHLTQGAQLLQKVRPFLKEFHTRAQRQFFKRALENVACIQPSVLDLIYKELAFDSSATNHPDTQERLRLIFLGNTDLITDMRHLNPGRPGGNFEVFFEALNGIVENISAADDRRHNVAHLSEFISLDDMISQAQSICPEDTPIPSKSLVRLQFAPKNPFTRTAHNFTSKINVQFKIQRRQLRAEHPDSHYCMALFKYLRSLAVENKNDNMVLLFCDDKAKVPVGEPGLAVSTGVRGRMSLVPSDTTLVALDHDMTKASLTPSVILNCEIPDSVDNSFVRGQVTTVINDSVFQQASPFRHSVVLLSLLRRRENETKVLLKFTDGGTDQRNTLESVKCASIAVFKKADLDVLILARCAPGQSWMNPAERVMSILNIGLQNVSLERENCTEEIDKVLKSCNSMASVRSAAAKNPTICEEWSKSIRNVKEIIENRFQRLAIKDQPFNNLMPASENDISELKAFIATLFPDLDITKLDKAHTRKFKSYQNWLDKHCRTRHYSFEITKCDDVDCCGTPQTINRQDLILPDPVMMEGNTHYKSYKDVKGSETTEEDRPSLQIVKTKKANKTPAVVENNTPTAIINFAESKLATTQNFRAVVNCIECTKPRVIYSERRFSEREKVSLAISLTEYDYTCGSPLLPPNSPLYNRAQTRNNLSCALPVEVPYYGSCQSKMDICSNCGSAGAEVNSTLKRQFKTVLQLCNTCVTEGKTPFVQRPYGNHR